MPAWGRLLSAALLGGAAVRSQSVETGESSSSYIPAVSEMVTKQEVFELEPVDATLRGLVYRDSNRNGSFDDDESPIQGAIVKLFDCRTGRRVGITRTGSDGYYGLTVTSDSLPTDFDSGSRGCFYVQYTVPNSVMSGAEFTTPLNGETNDIYLGAGDRRTGLEAGVYERTPEPTGGWSTPEPTTETKAPTEGVVMTLTPTKRPTTRAPTLAPATAAPADAEAVTMSPTIVLPMVFIPVPDDLLPAAATGAPSSGGGWSLLETASPATALVDKDTGEVITAETDAVVSDQVEESDTTISDQMEEPDAIDAGISDMLDAEIEEVEGERQDGVEESETTEPETSDEPNLDTADGGLFFEPGAKEDGEPSGVAEPVEDEDDETELKEVEISKPAKLTGPMDISAFVTVRLDYLQTMDESAQSAFEGVCTEFLSGVLKEFEHPIYNVDCAFVGQTAVSRRRRKLGRRGRRLIRELSRTRRRRLQVGIEAELEVSGTVDRTDRVQEPEDVMLESLLVGAFDVQGYLFADALKEESQAFSSLAAVSGVRSVVEQPDGAGVLDGTPTDGIFAPAVIGGIAAGGAVLLLCVLVAAGRSRKKKRRLRKELEDDLDSVESDPDLEGGEGGKRPRTPKNHSPANTRSTSSPSSSSSFQGFVSPCSSGEVEVSLPSPTARGPSSPDASLRNRVRRDVMTPPGKLGIMVANTKSHGPAVHTIRPGSVMEGLVYVNDIIVSVNDVDTSTYSAEQITQVMKDTVGGGRKITVLSAHR